MLAERGIDVSYEKVMDTVEDLRGARLGQIELRPPGT